MHRKLTVNETMYTYMHAYKELRLGQVTVYVPPPPQSELSPLIYNIQFTMDKQHQFSGCAKRTFKKENLLAICVCAEGASKVCEALSNVSPTYVDSLNAMLIRIHSQLKIL